MNKELILHFILYFIIYSFFGWLLESITKTIESKKATNSGFLKGPYCPIYGFGAIIMLTCLSFLKEKPFLLFISAFFILSIWEYIVGYALEKLFKTKYWDYSHLKFNINGRVCLKNSIYWGVLGLVFIRYIHVWVEDKIAIIPMDILCYIDIVIGIIFILDVIINVIETTNFEGSIQKINDIGEIVKEKLDEIKKLTVKTKGRLIESEKNKIQSIEKLISELKLTQAKLKFRMYKQAKRLKNAFPSMKSESITKFLNQKIDLEKLKENIKKKK